MIRLCRTISCDMAGKEQVARQLENDLGVCFGETTPDGKFTLEWANCLGMCDQGPAILVNEQIYTQRDPGEGSWASSSSAASRSGSMPLTDGREHHGDHAMTRTGAV